MRYYFPPPQCVFLHYLGENEFVKFSRVYNWYWFYFHKLFVFKPDFDIFAETHQKKILKIHVAVWHHTYFWVPLRYNKKLSCRRETAQCFVLLNITLSLSRSFEMTLLRRAWACSYLVPFRRYSALNNGVTLKTGLGVVQGRWKWRRTIDHMGSLISTTGKILDQSWIDQLDWMDGLLSRS